MFTESQSRRRPQLQKTTVRRRGATAIVLIHGKLKGLLRLSRDQFSENSLKNYEERSLAHFCHPKILLHDYAVCLCREWSKSLDRKNI